MDDDQRQEKFFAKLSGKRGEHLLVFSDEDNMTSSALERFQKPDISRAVAFEPGRSLHDDEWYVVALDDSQVEEMMQPYLKNAENNADNRTITTADYLKVVALYKTDGKSLVVTKITPGLRIESKTFIGLNDHPELTSYHSAIEFTGQVHAYYESGKLYFKDYSKISTLFNGIEEFYRNATSAEKEVFLKKSFFDVQLMSVDDIGMRESHKIAAILDDKRIKLDDAAFQGKVIAYAKEFVPEVISGKKLKIADKKTLHETLNLLTERYYKSELFGEKLEALDSAKIEPQ